MLVIRIVYYLCFIIVLDFFFFNLYNILHEKINKMKLVYGVHLICWDYIVFAFHFWYVSFQMKCNITFLFVV